MPEINWMELNAIVATTHWVEKHGGVRLSDEALQQKAEALNEGAVPMLGQHDWTIEVRARQMLAEGCSRLTTVNGRYNFEASCIPTTGAAWVRWGGMSFTTHEVIGRADGPHHDAEPLKASSKPSGIYWWPSGRTLPEAQPGRG